MVNANANHRMLVNTSCPSGYTDSQRRQAEAESAFAVSKRGFQFSNVKFTDDIEAIEEDAAKLGVT